MRYYRNFSPFMNNPLARTYLRWAYQKGVEDLAKLDFRPEFSAPGFSCLLCGAGNESTADEFIRFALGQSPHASIWIIDKGSEQVDAIRKRIAQKHPGKAIRLEQIDVFDLPNIISPESFDWIETDAFIQFFDAPALERLFCLWRSILKPNGFITTRDFISQPDVLRSWLMRVWLGVTIYPHTAEDLASLCASNDLRVTEGPTLLPTFRRFSMIRCNPQKA